MHNHIKHWTPELKAIARQWWNLKAVVLILEFKQALFPKPERETEIQLHNSSLDILGNKFRDLHNADCPPQDFIALDSPIIPPPPPDDEPPPQEPHP